MNIGVIGLGEMGRAMASSLLRAGHAVVVFNRTPGKAEALRAAGATVALELREACRGDAVITIVADDAAVTSVVCGERGVLDCLGPSKTTHVSMSTISPALVKELEELHRERNGLFMSAPVLGRPMVAAEGKLSILAAGDRNRIDALRPMFDALGKTFVVGAAPEAGNLVKVCCKPLTATIIEAISETTALVAKSGYADPKAYLEVLLSTMLATPLFQPYGKRILHDFKPGFRLPLALKDIELLLDAGHEAAVPLPLASMLRDHMLAAIAEGFRRSRLVGARAGR